MTLKTARSTVFGKTKLSSNHPESQAHLRVPLRLVLVVPFILQIAIAVGATAVFSLRNGQRGVNEVVSQLQYEVTAQISQHLTAFMETPQIVTEINANAIQFGTLDLQNTAILERHFWQQMRVFESLRPIAFGSEQGAIHAVDRMPDGSLVIRVIDASTNGEYHTYSIDQEGNRDRLLTVNTTFDPRTRPWYIEAVQAGKATWTEVYPYFSTLGLAISATLPIYDETGSLLGVTNATLSLAELGNFLNQLKIGQSGQTFIMERSGHLIASSSAEQPLLFRLEGNEEKWERVAASASEDPITRLTAQAIESVFGTLKDIQHSQQLTHRIEGEKHLIQVTPFRDPYGLDWLIVVTVPEADFMEYIATNTRTTILLCLAALLTSILIGILTSKWITQPIAGVIRASQEIAGGKSPQAISAKRIKELDGLVQAFNLMSTKLKASFAMLESANEELESRVEQRTVELQERSLQLKQALAFEAALKRISDRVLDTLDEAHILQTVVQEVTTVLSAECCSTAIYDPENKSFTIHYESTSPGWSSGQGQRVTLSEDPSDINLLLQDGCIQFCQLFPWLNQQKAAILACPIVDEQGIQAGIWLFRSSDQIYNDLEIRLVEQVANQCTIAIRQARLYQAAQSQVENLQKLNRLKDDFLNTVSHELRTPITNIKLAIHLLRLTNDPERQQQYLSILETNCNREVELINDLLDLQRMEAKNQAMLREPVDIQEWLLPLIEGFQSRIDDRQQILRLSLPENIYMIYSNREGLKRVLAELLNNACKYTPSCGEIDLTLTQDIYTSGSDDLPCILTQFKVANQAEISSTDIPHLFDKFYRVPHADLWNQGGTGLGLALVKKIVEQLEGDIQVTSENGWTTFQVTFKNALILS